MSQIRTVLVSIIVPSALLASLLPEMVQAQPRRATTSMTPADILRVATVSDPQISPNGDWFVYTVSTTEGEQTVSTLWLVRSGERLSGIPPTSRQPEQRRNWELPRNPGRPLLPAGWTAANPRWSPDGRSIAFLATHDGQHGIWVSGPERRIPRFVAAVRETNFFITYAGESLAWSPDSKSIAYISASEEVDRDSLDGAAKNDDPRVIDRLQYKSRTSFTDRLRTHVWLTEVEQPQPRQLTSGPFYDHALSFSPKGDEIAFISNHETDPDANNNSDIFTTNLLGQVRQLTQTTGCEYEPNWSPDGKRIAYTATKRNVTTIDSVAEDRHVWVTDPAGESRRELSAALDRRATNPKWLKDSRRIIFTAGEAGSTFLYSADPATGESKRVFPQFLKRDDPPELSSSISRGRIQVAGYSPFGDSNGAAAVIVTSSPTHLTDIEVSGLGASNIALVRSLTGHNAAFEREHEFVEPEEFQFKSFDGTSIQGWLMKPLGWREDRKYPMILSIHGGPHGMYGYAFNPTFQVYAARGYAVLYLNPRGSSGYGQKFSDGTINEWGGGDYRDLMTGVDEAMRRYNWIDTNRLGVTGGSYGGFMTNWIITQTPRFKAAVSVASLSNLISFYSTSLYQDLVHAEFGGFPWDNYDLLWQWSPLRYVRQAQTPTLFIHGEQDNDVHITQAEEMYMALRRRDVETVLVRYPREGHGLREPRHRVDALERTLAWFDRFLK
jgi:dipeptidyl aminopeptidase/acylaminoacyl peptidase